VGVLLVGLLLVPLLVAGLPVSIRGHAEAEGTAFWGFLLTLLSYVDLHALILLVGFLVGGTLLSCSFQNLWGAAVAVFTLSPLEAKAAARAAAVFRQLAQLTVGAGLLGSVVMFIHLFHQLDDPSMLGPMTVAVLFPVLYSSLLGSVLFYSLASDAQARSRAPETTRPLPLRRSS